MIKTKKQMFTLIGAFLLVIMLGTITYAFFNYTRTGTANTIRTGRIAFNSTQGTAINLTNMFPIDVTNGIPNDNTKVGTVTINVTGDTTYTEGLEYLVSAVNVQNTVGSKSLPISIDVAVANNTNNNPATALGTSDDDYFTDRGGDTSYYKVLAKETINTDDQLVVGYIAPGSTGVDGNIIIRAYLDSSRIAIADTYDGNETDNMGTTNEWVDDRTTFTTTEWNSLQTNGVSFQIKVESNEGIWVENPIICRRVTDSSSLHSEQCTNSFTSSSFCRGDGYLNTSVSYGNAKQMGSSLAPGDAFDCDVNKDGIYNSSNERFYYVSGLWKPAVENVSVADLSDSNFDNNYAVLIYFKNFVDGVASTDGAAYATKDDIVAAGYNVSKYDNWHGPVTAKDNLPQTVGENAWRADLLITTTRTIYACDSDCSGTPALETSGGTITPNPFNYGMVAGRLLTLAELKKSGCDTLSNKTSLGSIGALKACNFMLEGTTYTNSNNATYGVWLENPYTSYAEYVYRVSGFYRTTDVIDTNDTGNGVRPVIEIPLSKIEY